MINTIHITDLTVFDFEIPQQYRKWLTCTLIFYLMGFWMNMAFDIFLIFGMSCDFSVSPIIWTIWGIIGNIFSFTYVVFPTSVMARLLLTKLILISFAAGAILYIIYLFFMWMLYSFFHDIFDSSEPNFWDRNALLIFLMGLTPIYHSVMLFIIYIQSKWNLWNLYV